MTLKPDSLAFALSGAAEALAFVESGTALPKALGLVFESSRATPGARGAIQDLAYRSMRNWGLSQALLAALSNQPPQQAKLKTLLCCALTLVSETTPSYAPHTVVDQAVVAAENDPDLARAKGMVNAVLRRFLRERDSLLTEARRSEEAQWNYPQWWIDKTRAAWPDQWQAILSAGNLAPPLTLRVNQRKTSVADYLALLHTEGMEGKQVGPLAVKLAQAVPVARIPGFANGLVSVQDAAAQLAAPLLDADAADVHAGAGGDQRERPAGEDAGAPEGVVGDLKKPESLRKLLNEAENLLIKTAQYDFLSINQDTNA